MLNIGKGQNFHIKKALLCIMKGYMELLFAYPALSRHSINVLSDGNSEHRLKFSYNNPIINSVKHIVGTLCARTM